MTDPIAELLVARQNAAIELTELAFELGPHAPLHNADPACDHEIVEGNNYSGVKCVKCAGWYCI